MHFGKKLLMFDAPSGSRILDYKGLKKLIKAGEFDKFPGLLESEITEIKINLAVTISRLEMAAAKIQRDLVIGGKLISAEQLIYLKKKLKLVGVVTDDQLMAEEILALSQCQMPPQVEDFFADFQALTSLMEITACGIRKIQKKFRKRSGSTENVEAPFFEISRFLRLQAVAHGFCVYARQQPLEPLGAELSCLLVA